MVQSNKFVPKSSKINIWKIVGFVVIGIFALGAIFTVYYYVTYGELPALTSSSAGTVEPKGDASIKIISPENSRFYIDRVINVSTKITKKSNTTASTFLFTYVDETKVKDICKPNRPCGTAYFVKSNVTDKTEAAYKVALTIPTKGKYSLRMYEIQPGNTAAVLDATVLGITTAKPVDISANASLENFKIVASKSFSMQLIEKQDLTITWPRPEVIRPAIVGRFGSTDTTVSEAQKDTLLNLLHTVKGKGVTDDKTKIVVSLQDDKTTCTDVKKICGVKAGSVENFGGDYLYNFPDDVLGKYLFTKPGVLKINVYIVNLSDESVVDSATVSVETYSPPTK